MVESQIIAAAGLYYPEDSSAVFSTPGVSTLASGEAQGTKTPVNHLGDYALKYARWGTDNNWPKTAKQDIEGNPIMARAIKLRKDVHYGRGLVLYREEIEGEKVKKVPVVNEQFSALMQASRHRIKQKQFIADYEDLYNIFPEIILNDKREIVCINRISAYYCRWSKMDARGYIKQLAVSARWPIAQTADVELIEALDYDDPLGDLRSRKRGYKFILPVRMQERGDVYYDKPPWFGLHDGWLSVAFQVPRMKAAIMKNQMRIRYHIKMPYSYFKKKYKKWDELSANAQDKKVREEITRMNNWLNGVGNAGKSFISFFEVDPQTKKEYPGVKIEAIQDTFKEGAGNIDSAAANTEVLFALSVDPVLIGHLPGSTEAGSGSNKREAFSILQTAMNADREMTLEPWRFARDYMGIKSQDTEIGYRDMDLSQTLNKNPTGKKEVM